jgi:hypothetical protein
MSENILPVYHAHRLIRTAVASYSFRRIERKIEQAHKGPDFFQISFALSGPLSYL